MSYRFTSYNNRFYTPRRSVNSSQCIEDHGAGSKILHHHTRDTQQILKHNSSSISRAQLLYRIASYVSADRVLELGTSLGIATAALALAAKSVTSVEGSQAVAHYAQQRLIDQNIDNFNVVHGTFLQYFNHELDETPHGIYNLIFMDGHHDGRATLDYFEKLLPYCDERTVIIVDDIHWSRDMTRAWNLLTTHPQVTASINTYQWGILFLRPEQKQQAFHINL